MKHTQLPWGVRKHNGQGSPPLFDVVTKTGLSICGAFSMSKQPAKENAEFIVTACNNHYSLLEALKYVVSYHRENDSGEGELFGLDYVTTCIIAIHKAEGR